MTHNSLPKLNKRLIYGCLIAASTTVIPIVVFSTLADKKTHTSTPAQPMAMQAHNNANDAFAISGTERFPESYGELKDFENKIVEQQPAQEVELLEAMARLEKPRKNEQEKSDDGYYHHRHISSRKDDPWQEAKEREQKQRAFDYYDARRSDIMFIKNEHKGEAQREDVFFLKEIIKDPLPHMISQGTLIPAVLQTEIDTSLPGPILARVSHNIWDSKTGKSLLIPQSSTLIGEYNSRVSSGQYRAQIVWKRIIFPNQQSIDLGSMVGVDKKGTSGIKGTVDNHYDKVALALLMTTALGASVRMTQGTYNPNSSNIAQDLGNSLAQETARLGNKITDKMLSIPPTIKVPMGQILNVFVEKDLSLQPYAK